MATPDPGASSQPQNAVERIVYVYPSGPVGPNDDVDLRVLWNALVRDRWIVIALSLLGLVGGASYAWFAPSWFRAEVRLIPEALGGRTPLGTQSSPLGELAGLAGAALERDVKNHTIALVRSREFVRSFLVDEGLVDAVCGLAGASPNVETAIGIFTGRVFQIREDLPAGTVILGIEWKDGATAADVANRMVAAINRVSRVRAISEATTNIGFLREQLAESQDPSLRQVINKLLEAELQKLVVAKGRPEFAFRIMDPARDPGGSYWPRWRVTAAAGFVGGLVLALAIVFVRSVSRRPGK